MTQSEQPREPDRREFLRTTGVAVGALVSVAATGTAAAGKTFANGWYEAEEIYYIANGVVEGVSERGENELYFVGGNRKLQANVAEHIPGEPDYSPFWNVRVVHTASGKTVQDILDTDYASAEFPAALFDDVADIRAAEDDGLVTVNTPGTVVHCPIVSEEAAEAPGNTELPEDFPRPWPDTF